MINRLTRWYYTILYAMAHNGFLHKFALLEEEVKATMPLDYHWSEQYLNRIEYLYRRSQGIETTFKEVEHEYLCKCSDAIEKAIEEFKKQREDEKR